MQSFDLISDMHVDMNRAWDDQKTYDGISSFYPWHLQRQSDVLVIAGDCANDPMTASAVVAEAAEFYSHVFYVPGNHEHYIGASDRAATVSVNEQWLRDSLSIFPNVIVLNEYSVTKLGGTAVIGCTGWYDWQLFPFAAREQQYQAWKDESNDARYIRFDPEGFPDKLASRQAKALCGHVERLAVDDSVERIVVITHTIPHEAGVVSAKTNHSHLNGSYANTAMRHVMTAMGREKIACWVYGHTHFRSDFEAEGIRFVNNARGYSFENNGFTGLQQIDLNASREDVWAQLKDEL